MPKLILPFQTKGLYCPSNKIITKPSADFSKVAYFDKAEETVVNTDLPYISEQLVTQPFNNQGLSLNQGLYLHFFLPQILRSTIQLPINNREYEYEFPPIPNKWLILKQSKNGGAVKKYLIESDAFYLNPKQPASKVSVPMPWETLVKHKLNVPYRYMGKQYDLEQDSLPKGGEYWHNLLDELLTATGYGDITFTGFFPNCKDILSFYDAQPEEGTKYTIWGWYDFGKNQTPKVIKKLYQAQLDKRGVEFEEEHFKENWHLDFIDSYFSNNKHDLLLYSDYTVHNIRNLEGKISLEEAEKTYSFAIGNSGSEAISTYLAKNVVTPPLELEPMKIIKENYLEAIQFESLSGIKVDIGAKFVAERHRKSFGGKNGGWQYYLDYELTGNKAERSNIQKVLDYIFAEETYIQQYNGIKTNLIAVNKLQKIYDQNIRKIQSKQQQLFADWYKYMRSIHPPYRMDEAYPRGDDILRFLFNESIKNLKEIRNETGHFDILIEPHIFNRAESIEESLAQKIITLSNTLIVAKKRIQQYVNEELQKHTNQLLEAKIELNQLYFSEYKDLSNQGLVAQIDAQKKKIDALAVFEVFILQENGQLPTSNLKATEDLIKIKYTLSSKSSQRYYEANEPVLLMAADKTTTLKYLENEEEKAYSLSPSIVWEELDPKINRKFPQPPSNKSWKEIFDINNVQVYEPEWALLDWEISYLPIDDPALNSKGYDSRFIYEHFDIKPDTPDFSPIEGKEIPFSAQLRNYYGTTIITEGIQKSFQEVLNKFIKDGGQNVQEWLVKAQQLLASKEIFTQSIGGFNQALLMRKQTLQLEVADPIAFNDYQPLIKTIRDYIGDERQTAPVPSHYFNPIRAGATVIQRLRLIDTFGITHDIYTPNGDKPEILKPYTLQLPTEAKINQNLAHLEQRMVYLPPRFAQAGRMDLNWETAEITTDQTSQLDGNPICGWIMPNFLEKTIVFFEQQGECIGSIGMDTATSTSGQLRTFPKIGADQFYWSDFKNFHLLNVARYIFGMNSLTIKEGKDTPFEALLQNLRSSLISIEPENYAQQTQLSMLTGRPLVITRASINLEIWGDYALSQDWSSFKKDLFQQPPQRETYRFEQVEIPLRIGDYDQLNDGVIGFWYGNDNTARQSVSSGDTFYMPLAAKTASKKQSNEDKFHSTLSLLEGKSILSQTLDGATQVFTLLFDPRGNLNVSSGVLPVKTIDLPAKYFEKALERIRAFFLVSPLITPYDQLQVPLPKVEEGQWNWIFLDHNKDKYRVSVKPSIRQRIFEQLFRDDIEKANYKLWQILLEEKWLLPISGEEYKARLGNLTKELPLPFKNFEDKIKGVLREVVQKGIIKRTNFQVKYTDVIMKDYLNIWEELVKKKWLMPASDNAAMAWINFDLKTRKDLPKEYDEDQINGLLNTNAYGLSSVEIEPEYGQMSIKEGWLELF